MSARCPCCGAGLPGAVPIAELPDHFGGVTARMLAALADGRLRTGRELVELVYADCPDGGPLSGESCIAVMASKARPKLAALGWDLRGYRRLGGYRLRPRAAVDSA